MKFDRNTATQGIVYRAGLNAIREAVISSHFMHQLSRDSRLRLYDSEQFAAKSIWVPEGAVNDRLLPALLRASKAFARDRANAAKSRAARYLSSYGLGDPRQLGPAEFITEVMFDRQFRSSPRETCSRRDVRRKVAQQIASGDPIEMTIAALPYKFSCPLKTRGQSPDLAEANFLLGLYEIATAIELLYAAARPELPGRLARFTVVSDGKRFNALTNESDRVVESYQQGLLDWIERLGLGGHVELFDYGKLSHDRLPQAVRSAKEAIRERSLVQYSEIMWALFDPCDMAACLAAAARSDPDPERDNPRGRFVSLLESLVFTIRYRCLDQFRALPSDRFCALYRELTRHIFEPFALPSQAERRRFRDEAEADGTFVPTPAAKEILRQAMLREAWTAAIAYIAEIKSDREQPREPISICLPNHLRWTIHAKPGQLGLLTPFVHGKPVLAWAGAAVFKGTRKGGVRLSTLPVLALEGAGSVPVHATKRGDGRSAVSQPLFYMDPDLASGGFDAFLTGLEDRLIRKRSG